MAAFSEDAAWALLWPKEIGLDFLIEQCTMRMPRNLLKNRENVRHQKAVDPVTGVIVGYARWVLPKNESITEDGRPVWEEARVPSVSGDEERRYREQAELAWWNPRNDMDGMDDEIGAIMSRLLAEKTYIQLDYLAVHPDRKGQGIGTALVKSGIRFADEIGIPMAMIAFEAGRGIYRRHGFREYDRVVQDLSLYGGAGEYATYFMVRDVPVP